MTCPVEALRVAAIVAASRHKAREPRRLARALKYTRMHEAYMKALPVLSRRDPAYTRALRLSYRAAYLALAWKALARGDALEAQACRRNARALNAHQENAA